MTSNQIAYAGVKQQERDVDERIRHDKETERLTSWELEVKQRAQETDKSYKEDSIRIQEAWNNFNAKLESNKFEWTKELQQEELQLKARKQGLDEWYSATQANLLAEQNAIKDSANKENARHNKALESIQFWNNEIQEKKINYDYYALDIESGLRWEDLNLKRENTDLTRSRMLQDYSLGLMDIGIRQRSNNLINERLSFDKSKWDLESEMLRSKTGSDWTRTILPFVLPNASSVLSAGTSILGGF